MDARKTRGESRMHATYMPDARNPFDFFHKCARSSPSETCKILISRTGTLFLLFEAP